LQPPKSPCPQREIREQKSFVELAVDEAKLREQAIEILLRHRAWRRVPQSAESESLASLPMHKHHRGARFPAGITRKSG
jgi:hypothetical protein